MFTIKGEMGIMTIKEAAKNCMWKHMYFDIGRMN